MEGVIYSGPQFCNDLLLIWQGGKEIFNKYITAWFPRGLLQQPEAFLLTTSVM